MNKKIKFDILLDEKEGVAKLYNIEILPAILSFWIKSGGKEGLFWTYLQTA